MRNYACAAAAILLLGVSTPLRAHHGSAPHFDPDDQIRVSGIVTELRFVNPHAYVYFDAIDASGETVPWRCELSGATLLRRQGWTPETLVPGQSIEIEGARARREDNSCAMESITFEDGRVISTRDTQQTDVRPVADPGSAAPRPRYLENGQPNISGAWVSREGGGAGGILMNGRPEPTEAGLAASEGFDVRYEQSGDQLRERQYHHRLVSAVARQRRSAGRRPDCPAPRLSRDGSNGIPERQPSGEHCGRASKAIRSAGGKTMSWS